MSCGDPIFYEGLCDECNAKKIQVEEDYNGSGGL